MRDMDWIILLPFLIYLLVVLIVGIYGFKMISQTSTANFEEEYYIGSRSLGPWVLALSFAASLGSAGAFLGTPAAAYQEGFVWLIIGAAQTGSVFIGLGLLGKRLAIVGRKIKAFTVTQILEERFPHPIIRYYIPVLILIFITIYMVPQVIGGARVLEAMAGVPYIVGVIAVGLFTVIYTTLGGFRAASITDLIQGIFMAVGSFLLLVFVINFAGGISPIVDHLHNVKPELITPDSGGALGFAFMFSNGWLLLGIALLSLPHATVRGLAFKNSKALHKAMIIGTIATFAFTSMIWFVGASGHFIIGDIGTADHVIPLIVKELFPPIVAGLFLAVPFAAIMSTVDSMLLVVSSSLVEDIYGKIKKGRVKDKTKKRLHMWTTAIIGLLVIIMAMFPPELLLSLVFFSIGGLASTLLVPILFGLYWPRANTAGAITSTIGGGFSYLLFEQVLPSIGAFHSLTWSLLISLTLMVVVSLTTEKPKRAVLELFWG